MTFSVPPPGAGALELSGAGFGTYVLLRPDHVDCASAGSQVTSACSPPAACASTTITSAASAAAQAHMRRLTVPPAAVVKLYSARAPCSTMRPLAAATGWPEASVTRRLPMGRRGRS